MASYISYTRLNRSTAELSAPFAEKINSLGDQIEEDPTVLVIHGIPKPSRLLEVGSN
jgi:hypothetical protein